MKAPQVSICILDKDAKSIKELGWINIPASEFKRVKDKWTDRFENTVRYDMPKVTQNYTLGGVGMKINGGKMIKLEQNRPCSLIDGCTIVAFYPGDVRVSIDVLNSVPGSLSNVFVTL